MKITNTDEIQAAYAEFNPADGNAHATGRVLPGQHEQENQQEWAERGTIKGKSATVYYIFENSEAEVEDGGDIPFDEEHVSIIEVEALT